MASMPNRALGLGGRHAAIEMCWVSCPALALGEFGLHTNDFT